MSDDSLESRISLLENKVFGSNEKDADYPKCIQSLLNSSAELKKVTADKKAVPKVYNRLTDLQKFLDPTYTDEMMLSADAMTDVVLSEEEFLREQAKRLEQMENLKEYLDSAHIKGMPSHFSKLQELSEIQIKQQDDTGVFTEDVRKMLENYNNIIALLSKQLLQWDQMLTVAEKKAQTKRS